MNSNISTQSFNGLSIAPKLLEILDKNSFKIPTPIQLQSIPTALEGKDIMGIAQTGTGKTLAFGIPMLQRLAINKGKGLVLLPTRELAVQVDESLNKIGRPLGLKTAILIGGESMGKQLRQIRNNPHLIIATPGRLIDHLEQKSIKLDAVNILVLDEADRMLDMGFAPQIKKILNLVPKDRQTMLFSATMPTGIVDIAKNYLKLPVRIEVAPQGSSSKNITQELFVVRKEQKIHLLESLLKEYSGSVLIFSRTKFGAKKIAAQIRRMGHSSTEIHSNRSLSQRLEALNGFKLGKYKIMVATDIAARGIDVTGIEVVINFDLPQQAEDYVHRIGRTGRASHLGHAITFATPDQRLDVRAIERLIKKELPVSKLPPALPSETPEARPQRDFKHTEYPARNSPYKAKKNFKDAELKPAYAQKRGESGQGYFIQKPQYKSRFGKRR
ncbi:MAG: DEAD/DEAH box helicase [Candidatus Doudnabacteria bacterium]|nr:DEAD/DEAH box helicase [Candidatus Doudnabacteria bacterium]